MPVDVGVRRSRSSLRLAIVAGGAIGTLLRYGLGQIPTVAGSQSSPGLPVGTLFANVLGALALGYVVARVRGSDDDALVERWTPVTAGLLGALTTFSTFVLEVADLLDTAVGMGLLYLAGSLVLGFGAAVAGRRLATPDQASDTRTASGVAR